MKLRDMGRGTMASMLTLAMLLGVTACDNNYTLAFVYATAAGTSSGLINAYGMDAQQGTLRVLADSPIPSGGRNPVAVIASPDHLYLYVLNHDDSNVAEFAIGTDGKLYPENTYNTTGSFPTAGAISPDGKFLYVVNTYQNGANNQAIYTPASPGPGSVSIYPINTTGAKDSVTCNVQAPATPSVGCLGTPTTFNVGRTPMGVTVSQSNNFVYVIAQDAATSGNLFAFARNVTTGALSITPQLAASEQINAGDVVSTGFTVSTMPGGILGDSSSAHLYVTDEFGNQLIGYSVDANGVPTQIGKAATDAGPQGIAIDPTGTYLYTANYTAGTIGGYTFGPNGQPVLSTASPSVQGGTGITCVTIEPSRGIYLYTSNSLSNTVSAEQIIPQQGGLLKQILGSPYASGTLPTCTVAVPRVF